MISPKDKKPNIILIVMDAVRAQNISCYGYSKRTTPMLERILPSSVLYRNMISSSYWTLPSHASMFTGTYLSKHGLVVDGDVSNPDFMTLAEFLKMNGYFTVGLCGNDYVSGFSGLDRGFDRFYGFESTTGGIQKIYNTFRKVLRENYSKKLVNKRIFWFLTAYFDKGAKTKNNILAKLIYKTRNRPFFAFVHYDETHSPYHPPKQYREYFLTNEMRKKKDLWNVNQDHIRFFLKKAQMDELDFRILKALYDGSINYLDQKIYEIYSLLLEENLLDDTMVIITSDHGDNIGEHNMMFHWWCLYDTLIKVPLVIKYPKDYNLCGEEDRLVQNVDLMPTIIDMLDLRSKNLLSQIQGNSLLSGKIKNRSYHYAISELMKPFGPKMRKYTKYFRKYDRGLICIRTKDKKYIWASNGKNEFYDLKKDPEECTNLIHSGDPSILELEEDLELWLERFNRTYREIRQKINFTKNLELDRNIEERLKKLGYF